MPSVLVVQHAEIESTAALEPILREQGCELAVVRPDLGDPVPADLSEHSGLIVMGGMMSATSDDGFRSRLAEIALLRAALDTAAPVIGICLGAQLLAAAAGGAVYAGPEPEIGWKPVTFTDAAATDPLFAGLAGPLTVLHWHGDTFDVPADAIHLASSAQYPSQAFRMGETAWGLQFHVEVDEVQVERFIEESGGEVPGAPGGADAIRRDARAAAPQLVAVQQQIATRFARLALECVPSR
jgi:GMP synthase-like glutamine amidotransferase